MNNSENVRRSRNDDEIDLISVIKAIGAGISSFFTRIFNFILRIISYVSATAASIFINVVLLSRKLIFAIAKNYVLFIILILLGSTAGIILHKYIRPYYTGTIIIASEGLKGLYFKKVVTNLDDLAHEENYIELGRKLNLDTIISKNIKGIDIEIAQFINTKDELMSEIELLEKEIELLDTANLEQKAKDQEKLNRLKIQLEMGSRIMNKNENEFKINFYVYAPEILPTLKDRFMEYLETNSFGKKRVDTRFQTLEKQKAIYYNQITQLDTLKKIINSSFTEFYKSKESKGSNNITVGAATQGITPPPNPFTIYQKEFELREKQLEIEKELAMLQNIEIIQDLSIFKKPSSISQKRSIGVGILSGFALFFGFIGLSSLKLLNNYLDDIEAKRASRKTNEILREEVYKIKEQIVD